jgi:oligosaccharide repeat unit polymerase
VEELKYLFLSNLVLVLIFYFILFGRYWHSVFLFIGTLTLFQGGLIISSIFDNTTDLSYVWLMGANFFLKEDTIRLSILLISLSYWLVLLGAYLGNSSKIQKVEGAEYSNYNFLKGLFLTIFLISLPFYAYKQFSYFNYFLQYGYLGFYQSTSYLEKVGFIVRAISFLSPVTFLAYFFLEKNKKFIFLISIVYFILSIPTLLSGFRGDFFTFWITVFLFYKYRFNNKLSFKGLFILIVIISIIGLSISYMRENLSYSLEFTLNRNPILEFFRQQGVSFYVTAMAIEFKDEFAKNILNYLMWEPISAIFPNALSMPKRAFATDLMIKINYKGYLMGYGTGSSYLAEAYLLGGLFAVCLISFFIGYILSKLFKHFNYANIYIKIVILTVIQYAIFLPRDLLLMPLSQAIKVSVYLLSLFLLASFIKEVILYIKRG